MDQVPITTLVPDRPGPHLEFHVSQNGCQARVYRLIQLGALSNFGAPLGLRAPP